MVKGKMSNQGLDQFLSNGFFPIVNNGSSERRGQSEGVIRE